MILFFEVNGRGKDILGTLLTNAVMDLDVLFALGSDGRLFLLTNRCRVRSVDLL
jgi:hypothetical protein